MSVKLIPIEPCDKCGTKLDFVGDRFRCLQCEPIAIDANVEAVREKLRIRAEHGVTKYGVTTERTDLTRKQWLIHAQEEALDLAVYLQRLISDEPEDSACPKCGHSQFHTE